MFPGERSTVVVHSPLGHEASAIQDVTLSVIIIFFINFNIRLFEHLEEYIMMQRVRSTSRRIYHSLGSSAVSAGFERKLAPSSDSIYPIAVNPNEEWHKDRENYDADWRTNSWWKRSPTAIDTSTATFANHISTNTAFGFRSKTMHHVCAVNIRTAQVSVTKMGVAVDSALEPTVLTLKFDTALRHHPLLQANMPRRRSTSINNLVF